MSRPDAEGLNPFGLTAKEARMIADHVEVKEAEKLADQTAWRRERIAISCMEGLLANDNYGKGSYDSVAEMSVMFADALIARLDS